jgi:RNA polymerase sigma factor (sigma-70 family)
MFVFWSNENSVFREISVLCNLYLKLGVYWIRAEMDERTLIDKCLKGDQRSQRELFDKYAPKMYTVCLRYSKNSDEAQDVLQESFIKVFNKLNVYQGNGSFEGWIRRITVNTALDSIRKNLKFQDNSTIDDHSYRIEQETFHADGLEEEDLMKMIAVMPVGYRVVFNMFAIEGFSHKEIAEQLNISENTSKSQYSRARAYLIQKLEEIGFER